YFNIVRICYIYTLYSIFFFLFYLFFFFFFFFFFQAEDGIRDLTVTGVQTCALPISRDIRSAPPNPDITSTKASSWTRRSTITARSEERRVGKECRSRWSPDH